MAELLFVELNGFDSETSGHPQAKFIGYILIAKTRTYQVKVISVP